MLNSAITLVLSAVELRLVTTKIAKQKLDVMVEEVAARMSDFITRNRNKIVELYSAIGVLAEYQAEVKYFQAQQNRFSFRKSILIYEIDFRF